MRRLVVFFNTLAICLALATGLSQAQGHRQRRQSVTRKPGLSRQSVKSSPAGPYLPVHTYDPKRNGARDIREALMEARRTGRRVLLEVGGEWCIWCHRMDEFFEKHPELLELREKSFIMVKINYSDENRNEPLLSRYPEVAGYPHLFVLDTNGKLLHSQDTGKLEDGNSYNLDKFMTFLKKWAVPEKQG